MIAPRAVRRLSVLLLDSLCPFCDEQLHARILFVHATREIARPIFEQHNEAKREDNEKGEPKHAAQNRHAKG